MALMLQPLRWALEATSGLMSAHWLSPMVHPSPVYPGAMEAQGLGASWGFSHAGSVQPALFKVLGWTQDAESEAPARSEHTAPTGQTAMILRPQPAKNGPDLYLGSSKALPQEFWSGPASVMSQRCLSWYLPDTRPGEVSSALQ